MIRPVKQIHLIVILATLSIALSTIIIGLNTQIFHFTGNNYCPPEVYETSVLLVLLFLGAYSHGGLDSRLTKTFILMLIYFGVLAVVILATDAVQYTPFTPIDESIVKLEPIDIVPIIAWTRQHDGLKNILAEIYNSLSLELVIIPCLLIVSLRREHLYEYLILILCTALIGFGFYYFFPTTAPASILNSEYFASYQRATGIKFHEIHNHIPPSTIEGGLVSFPSFHVIWSWLNLYAIRSFRVLFWILLPYNMLIVASCVMLGWHYLLDIFGSMVVIICAHGFCIMHRATAKRSEAGSENHACIQ